MCGIFGYYSHNTPRDLGDVLGVLFQGLRRLEYRGYDSAGFCIDVFPTDSNNDDDDAADDTGGRDQNASDHRPFIAIAPTAVVIKSQGKVDDLHACADKYIRAHKIDLVRRRACHVAISHTRWATHGPPSASNAHPHTSDTLNEFVVVHNGIITNYAELRDWLTQRGEMFLSDTDTEVIPKLCRYVFNSLATINDADDGGLIPFPRLVMEVLKRLEGAYAILIRSAHYPGEVIACKRGSPLICGIHVAQSTRAADSLDAQHHADAALDAASRKGFGPTVESAGSFAHMSQSSDQASWAPSLECWIASDASAVVDHTKQVLVLEDGDVFHACGGGWGIYNTRERDFDLLRV